MRFYAFLTTVLDKSVTVTHNGRTDSNANGRDTMGINEMGINENNLRTLRNEAAARGDTGLVRICDKAICGDIKAIAECYRIMLDCDEEDARGWH